MDRDATERAIRETEVLFAEAGKSLRWIHEDDGTWTAISSSLPLHGTVAAQSGESFNGATRLAAAWAAREALETERGLLGSSSD